MTRQVLRVEDRGLADAGDIDTLLDESDILALVVQDRKGSLGLVMLCEPSPELAIHLAAAAKAYCTRVLALLEQTAQAQTN